jgi:hypothetical protein
VKSQAENSGQTNSKLQMGHVEAQSTQLAISISIFCSKILFFSSLMFDLFELFTREKTIESIFSFLFDNKTKFSDDGNFEVALGNVLMPGKFRKSTKFTKSHFADLFVSF